MYTSFRKDRMLLANNYCLYYGYGRVEEMALFDLAIVESKGLTEQEINKLKSYNTLVFTYLSLLEVHPTEKIFQELSNDDFIIVDGKPLINEAFGTYLVNLQSKKWIDYLLKEIHLQIKVLESDGLFIDTIGDIELNSIPVDIRNQQIKAAVNFLYVLKILYPEHLIIQNNGLESVCLETAPYIDGMCWENPPLSLKESKDWVNIIEKRLSLLKEKYHLKIFLLLEETTENERNAYEIAKKFAKENDFLLYNAPSRYVEGVNVIKG